MHRLAHLRHWHPPGLQGHETPHGDGGCPLRASEDHVKPCGTPCGPWPLSCSATAELPQACPSSHFPRPWAPVR